MERPFECPECGCRHDEPAEAAYAIAVRCLDCELESLYRAGRQAEFDADLVRRAA